MAPVGSRAGLLSGKRIVVTRPFSQDEPDPLVGLLQSEGADVLWLRTQQIVPPDDWAPLDEALATLQRFDWIAFTSSNAVRAVAARLAQLGVTWGSAPRKAAVGRKTAEALAGLGPAGVLVPTPASAEALAALLGPRVAGQRVLWPRGRQASETFAPALRASGAAVVEPCAYQMVRLSGAQAGVTGPAPDAATFGSARAVEETLTALGAPGVAWLAPAPCVCIGEGTARALEVRGLRRVVVAKESSLEGLCAGVVGLFAP